MTSPSTEAGGTGTRARFWLLVVLAVSMSSTPACGFRGLSFVVDDRVDILAPKDRSTVSLPLRLRWESRDFDGTYAVFLDRPPQPPGKTPAWLVRNDDSCRADQGCPDADYLAGRGIFTTDATELVIEQVPFRSDEREFHEAVVVLLDERGRRLGESAFAVQFEVERPG